MELGSDRTYNIVMAACQGNLASKPTNIDEALLMFNLHLEGNIEGSHFDPVET